jgi:hypothetical protein
MSGISLKGSLVFNIRMVFLRTGPGIKIAKPSKPMMQFSPGTGMFEMSWACRAHGNNLYGQWRKYICIG